MFFEICFLLSITIIYISCVLIACANRGTNHIILRRLGVKELTFWAINIISVFIPALISCTLCGIVWHYTGVMPFSNIKIEFALFEMLLIAIQLTMSSTLLACMLGRNNIISVVSSCFIGLFTIIVPGILHTAMF